MAISEGSQNEKQPAGWAVDRATDELYDEQDSTVVEARAWEMMRAEQQLADERHDEFDDPDQGGEA